jgi:hypothetical protein
MVSLKIDVFLTFADRQASKQASRQFMFARLFSTRKRIIQTRLLYNCGEKQKINFRLNYINDNSN